MQRDGLWHRWFNIHTRNAIGMHHSIEHFSPNHAIPTCYKRDLLVKSWIPISAEERKLLERVRAAMQEFIDVDDFDPAELRAAVAKPKSELRSVA